MKIDINVKNANDVKIVRKYQNDCIGQGFQIKKYQYCCNTYQ